jgi:uncharacterized protein DUF4337
MEELEPPIEHLHETVHHEAHHSQEAWITMVALSTALLAGLAAVAALLSGYHANTAVMDKVAASDQWAFYQSKSIKESIVQGKLDLAELLEKPVNKKDKDKIAQYKTDKAGIKKKAEEMIRTSHEHFERHEMLARSVTMFQVAIAVAAIAVLTKRRWFWYMGLLFGVIGAAFLAYGITFTPKEEVEGTEAAVRMVAPAELLAGGAAGPRSPASRG